MKTAIQKLNQAEHALAQARTLREIKSVTDLAEAARRYAKVAHLSLESYNYAAGVKLRAQRKAGEVLRDLKRRQGERTDKLPPGAVRSSEYAQTLRETKTPESTARDWQKIAIIPLPAFNSYLSVAHDKGLEITTGGLFAAAFGRRMRAAARLGMKAVYDLAVPASGAGRCPHCHVRLKITRRK